VSHHHSRSLTDEIQKSRQYVPEDRLSPHGLDQEPRPGFDELKEWVRKDRDLRYILCLDPSRWCRFVDNDLAVAYFRECLKAGLRVVYTILDMPPDADSLYSTFLHFNRWLAAPRCCQHGVRVQRGRLLLRRRERGGFPEGSGDVG
jgi:hypothetical protein